MDATEPIADETDFIRRREVVARLAWLEHRLATTTRDTDDEDTTDDEDDNTGGGEETAEELDERQRRSDEVGERITLSRFLAMCDTAVGLPEWEAVNDTYWADYAADVAADLFGDAVLQDAWSDEVWAVEYAEGWRSVPLGGAAFHVCA